ncbi:MAG: NAD(P)-dependent oxidoreductase [Verrucomicrobiae bacterium]|nr:NAD(P)-dependent oxidoreductase [Verrucomicrobiae bacterium]MCP5542209.1 NAD(P)-dependent oxidoreductase [Akkermansiaceae bacterium]
MDGLEQHKIGVAGTGFISRGFVKTLHHHGDLSLEKVLTRRDPATCGEFPRPETLTRSLAELVDACDLVVECSGDVIHATEVVNAAVEAGKPVVTMDAEFHVTAGSWFAGKGYVTEAEGDQPGCLANLYENVTSMGFRPLVLGNVKGFQDKNPARESMEHWAKKQGISLDMVISATDGTKIHFEQALVANGLGADILDGGMVGEESDDMHASAQALAERAKAFGGPISDFAVIPRSPYRVFITAEHDEDQWPALEYYKFGPGPFFTISVTNILCHFEIVKTIRRALRGGPVLLDNSADPRVSVAAFAKGPLPKGHRIGQALGSFDIRGESVRIVERPDHVPIGLLKGAVLETALEPGQIVTFADVSIPDSLALRAWREILARKLENAPASAA